jgi:hypothetical protein
MGPVSTSIYVTQNEIATQSFDLLHYLRYPLLHLEGPSAPEVDLLHAFDPEGL